MRAPALLLISALSVGCAELDEDELLDGATVANIYNQEFEGGWSSKWTISRGATQVSGGYTGKALRSRIPVGGHHATDMSLRLANVRSSEPDEMYFRYYLRFGSSWAPAITGKLPGVADLNGTSRCKGGYRPKSGECWSARMMWRPVTGGTDIGYYLYHPDQVDRSGGDGNEFGDGDLRGLRFEAEGYTPLQRNRWYCIEGHVGMNTPNVKNGVLEGWVNGKPALRRTDIRFRLDSRLHVERFWHNIYYGGKAAAPATMDVYVDRVALSTTRIGCDSLPDDPMWEPGAEAEMWKDMPPGSFAHGAAIELGDRGITSGCQGGANPMFCPRAQVTRSQMAAFFSRALGLPAAARDYFTDDTGSIFEDAHNRIAAAGITQGCGATTFCGGEPVTRGQMAAFIARGFALPATDDDFYADDDGTLFEGAINKMIAAGISSGCSATSFCADADVTRAQMAIFLVRALAL